MRRLVYVSNNVILPNGAQNPFFLQEKALLAKRFGEFDVICPQGSYVCDGEQLRLCSKNGAFAHLAALLRGALDPRAYRQLPKMRAESALCLRNVLKVFRYAYQAALLRPGIEAAAAEGAVLYSYWLSYDAYAVAQVRSSRPDLYAFSRAHSYELQLRRNACNPYLMKEFTCENLDRIAFISKGAVEDLSAYYSGRKDHFAVRYLGSSGRDAACIRREKKQTLTLVSCSAITPVKQLEQLVDALQDWCLCPVRWEHLGEGAQAEQIKALAREKLGKNSLVEYVFHGYVQNPQVRSLLRSPDVDVFVNCSKAEGVPVSIMEAMSFGLPVIAPRICGIPELVVSGTGLLYEARESAAGLRAALECFARMEQTQRQQMGQKAFCYWREHFCLEKNLTELMDDVEGEQSGNRL